MRELTKTWIKEEKTSPWLPLAFKHFAVTPEPQKRLLVKFFYSSLLKSSTALQTPMHTHTHPPLLPFSSLPAWPSLSVPTTPHVGTVLQKAKSWGNAEGRGCAKDGKRQKSKEIVSGLVCDPRAGIRVGMRNAEEQSSEPGCPLCHRLPLCPPSPHPLPEDPSEQRAPHTARHPHNVTCIS